MSSDLHTVFRNMIDATLVAGPAAPQDPALREHLRSCLLCQQYLETTNRAIASLGSFSFEMDPSLQTRVFAALELRAEPREPAPFNRKRFISACLIAVVFTGIGSFFDLQFGGVLASFFHIPSLQIRQDLLSFWIVPSLIPLLLFPILPLLSTRKERVL